MIPSERETLTVQCPACGQSVQTEVVYVIQPETPELEQLMGGQLNLANCKACDTAFLMQTPLLYRDDEDCFLAYYMPVEDDEKQQEAVAEINKINSVVFDDDIQPTCRLTFSQRRFIEKIMIQDHGLDDRVIEYMKYQLFNRPDQKIDPVRFEMLYDFSRPEPDVVAFVLFDRETGEASAAAHLPLETYDELVATFLANEPSREELEKLFPGPVIAVDGVLF